MGAVPTLRRRWLIGMTLLAAGLAFVLGVLLWQAVELGSLATVSERVQRT